MRIRNNQLIFEPQSYTTVGASVNDLTLTSTNLYITPTTNNDAITGLSGANKDGLLTNIYNPSSTNTLVLKHANSGSAVGNRFDLPGSVDLYILPGKSVQVFYSNSSFRAFSSSTGKSLGYLTAYQLGDITAGAIDTPTAVTLNNNVEVSGALSHSTVSNTSRILSSSSGIMSVVFTSQIQRPAGGAGANTMSLWFRKNGVDVDQTRSIEQFDPVTQRTNIMRMDLAVTSGDYIELYFSVTLTSIKLDSSPTGGGGPNSPAVRVIANLTSF